MSSIDDFLDALHVAFENAGTIVPWPLHVAQVAPYYSDLEAIDLMERFRTLRAGGTTDLELARLYPSASSATSLMLDLVPGMKVAGIGAADRAEFVQATLRGLAALEAGDVFARDGGHRLLSGEQAQQLAEETDWQPAAGEGGRDFAAACFGLSGAAQSLVWSAHFYGWTDISFVIHGPYRVTARDGRARTLIVRDFFDLDFSGIWPLLPDPGLGKIRLLSLHDDSDEFRIDLFNHLLHARAQVESTQSVSLVIDGRTIMEADTIKGLRKRLIEVVRAQKANLDQMAVREIAAKFIESRYYAFRRWRLATGGDPLPPAQVYERLAEWPAFPAPQDGDESWEILRDLFDPRSSVGPQAIDTVRSSG
jgi:hypothetical protein